MINISKNGKNIILTDGLKVVKLATGFNIIDLSNNENYAAATLETPAQANIENLYLFDNELNLVNKLKAPKNISQGNIFTDVKFVDDFTDLMRLRDWDGHQYFIYGKNGSIVKKDFNK
ncbi:hypothetical protein ACNQFN_11075 [Thauera butanivorans]|uniref:hypothetical protein n=1 Tax=Thauera butanivorans TaxID=86174 RepID=UPI003AB12DEF